MKCPQCGYDDRAPDRSTDDPKHSVLETRKSPDGRGVGRRRKCPKCEQTFQTIEEVSEAGLRVVKSDGSVERLERKKIWKSIKKAAVKKYSRQELNELVDTVVEKVHREADGVPIPSREIGRAVVAELAKQHDPASRIRYALVQAGRTDRTDDRDGWTNAADVRQWLVQEYPELEHYRVATGLAQVVKKDGRREPFSPAKLEKSIGRASKGRGSEKQVWDKAEVVRKHVMDELSDQPLVTTSQISAEILRFLRKRDHIAYLRYASTAKGFTTPEDYENEAFPLREGSTIPWEALEKPEESNTGGGLSRATNDDSE